MMLHSRLGDWKTRQQENGEELPGMGTISIQA